MNGERYCHCVRWRRFLHTPSEHAWYIRAQLSRKGSRLAQLVERMKAEAST